MAVLFGAIPIDEDLPFHQWTYHVGCGTVADSTVGSYPVGTFTMPWAGDLFANFVVVYYWNPNAFQHIAASMVYSTPAPTNVPVFNHMAMNSSDYLRGQLPIYAQWANLAKGQNVTLTLAAQVGGGGVSVVFEALIGSVRAMRN